MIIFPSAIDYVRIINTNAIDNLLAGKPAYVKLPSLYKRAYMLVHETGTVRGQGGFEAPREPAPAPKVSITKDPRVF